MGLFSFFKGKNEPEQAKATELYAKAKSLFEAQDYSECLRTLTQGFSEDITYKPFYQLAVSCLEKLGGAEEAQLFKAALADFKNYKVFFDLGYHFIDVQHPTMARPFLEYAYHLHPQDDLVKQELSLACSARFDIARALMLMEEIREHHFWTSFRTEWLRLLNGDGKRATAYIQTVEQNVLPGLDEEQRRETVRKLNELREMRDRLAALGPQREQRIRDWHFIQYGGAILELMDEAETHVAGGRHVALWGGVELVQRVLLNLGRLLDATGNKPAKIAALPDRDSRILALAASALLHLPLVWDNGEGLDQEDTLIIAASAESLNASSELLDVRKGQLLFAFETNWLERHRYSPDITGVMAQHYTFPWAAGNLRVNPDTQQVERSPADMRAEKTIAEEIVALKPENQPADAFAELLTFYSNVSEHLKGIGEQARTHRYVFIVDSPVPGSYFG